MTIDERLQYPHEKPLFIIGAILSGIVWAALVCTLVGVFYGVVILAFLLIAQALYLAHVRGNGMRVSEQQYPAIWDRCRAAAEKLHLTEVPAVYVIQAGGLLNALATKLLFRKFVIVYSNLVESCKDPRQLDFVIGHEMGHLAAGHLFWQPFLAPYRLVPWLGPAYSRACEYTADRCGLEVAGDLEQSQRGLIVLAAGGKLAVTANLQAFMEQRNEAGTFWMAVLELVSTHPYLCKRAAHLQEITAPGTVPVVGRNVFAWILAPMLGAPAGGLASGGVAAMMMIAIMGILAAIAIPNFIKYKERAALAAMHSSGLGSSSHGLGGGLDSLDKPSPFGDADALGSDTKLDTSSEDLKQLMQAIEAAKANDPAFAVDPGGAPSQPRPSATKRRR